MIKFDISFTNIICSAASAVINFNTVVKNWSFTKKYCELKPKHKGLMARPCIYNDNIKYNLKSNSKNVKYLYKT